MGCKTVFGTLRPGPQAGHYKPDFLSWVAIAGVEGPFVAQVSRPARRSFNGATPLQAWTGVCTGQKRSVTPICFNGATPFQAWKEQRINVIFCSGG